MIRVALLANFPRHVLPGAEGEPAPPHYATWLPQLAEGFESARDFEFHWITISRRQIAAPISWKGQTFHYLHNPQKLRQVRGYLRDTALIRARVAELRPDLIHAWGSEDCYGLTGARLGLPWLLSMQGLLQEYARRAPMHPWARLQAWYEASILRRARDLTVESRWGEQMLQHWAPHARISRVEYGVPESFFHVQWEPDPARPRAVFVGSCDERKGVADAVRAFAAPALRHAELHVLGDGDDPYSRRLRERAPTNVHWHGRVSREQTIEALRTAWCLVLPTRADTSPNVVKEARVIGLPVITTPHGGQSDYIRDGVNGFLVEPGEIDQLANRLAQMLTALTEARAMGASLHGEQRAFFRPERTAAGFLKLYRSISSGELLP